MWQAIYRGRRYRFEWLESRLLRSDFGWFSAGGTQALLLKPGTRRLKISSNPSQYDDLTLFIREQEVVQELVKKSVIPSLRVDVTDYSLDKQVDYIADWLEATGGLNATERNQSPKERFCQSFRD